MIRGSCLCGAAAFEIDGKVSPMQTCHCSRCRKTSGSAFATALMTAARSFRWVRGRERVAVFELPTGFRHAFCRVCGSPLPGPEPSGKVVPFPAGCLDDDPGTRPFRHTFVGSKAPWYEIADELPQHPEWAAEPVRGDPKQIVTSGYDTCGRRFNAQRDRAPAPQLERLIRLLPDGARALDVGCGGGVPVTRSLARRAQVVGVDISPEQVAQAREAVPGAELIAGDIMAQAFAASSFDAVVSFYTLFHLPRDEHRTLLERFATWLKPGGYLLVTLARSSHAGYTEPDFFGARMYWSHHDPDWYAGALADLGFRVLDSGELGHGYRDGDVAAERHPVVLARLNGEGA